VVPRMGGERQVPRLRQRVARLVHLPAALLGYPHPHLAVRTVRGHTVIGTIAELEERSGKSVPDPHRPYVDGVTIPCPCGGEMRRVADIFDVWFDSAVASWATLRFPRDREGLSATGRLTSSPRARTETRGGSTLNSAQAPLRLAAHLTGVS